MGRPWRRHAANPAVSWAIIEAMNATLPPAKWVYLRRDPYNQICNCLIRKWCHHNNLDYYLDKPTWQAAAPLLLTGEDLQACMDDFEVVAMAAIDLVPALPVRGYGPVVALSYEELCTQPERTMARLCGFLGLECSAQYVGAIAAFLRSNGRSLQRSAPPIYIYIRRAPLDACPVCSAQRRTRTGSTSGGTPTCRCRASPPCSSASPATSCSTSTPCLPPPPSRPRAPDRGPRAHLAPTCMRMIMCAQPRLLVLMML